MIKCLIVYIVHVTLNLLNTMFIVKRTNMLIFNWIMSKINYEIVKE